MSKDLLREAKIEVCFCCFFRFGFGADVKRVFSFVSFRFQARKNCPLYQFLGSKNPSQAPVGEVTVLPPTELPPSSPNLAIVSVFLNSLVLENVLTCDRQHDPGTPSASEEVIPATLYGGAEPSNPVSSISSAFAPQTRLCLP